MLELDNPDTYILKDIHIWEMIHDDWHANTYIEGTIAITLLCGL